MATVHAGKTRKRDRSTREKCVIQIVLAPAFHAVRAVQLYRSDHIDGAISYYAVKLTWDQLEDQRNYMGPIEKIKTMRLEQLGLLTPTIQWTDADVDAEFGRHIENNLHVVSLPMPRSSVLGLDGETWTIRVGDPWVGVEYHWWCNCPDEWRLLGEIVHDVWSALQMDDGSD